MRFIITPSLPITPSLYCVTSSAGINGTNMCTDSGLCGCCAPSLYCNSTHCYTTSLAAQNNYYVNSLQGLSANVLPSFSPVFICNSISNKEPIPKINSLKYESNSIISIAGTHSLTHLLTYLLTHAYSLTYLLTCSNKDRH